MYIKEKEISPAYFSKINLICAKQIILLMVPNEEKEDWHYLAIKKTIYIINPIPHGLFFIVIFMGEGGADSATHPTPPSTPPNHPSTPPTPPQPPQPPLNPPLNPPPQPPLNPPLPPSQLFIGKCFWHEIWFN